MDPALLVGLVMLSLLPPLLFALNVRAQERHDREPVRAVVGTFLWGGTIGVLVALVLHAVFAFGYQQSGAGLVLSTEFAAVVIAAPIVEELAKGMGLRVPRRHMMELEDGLVYGAAIGLGFAATENLVYGIVALADGGFTLAFSTVALRVISAMLLHASASAIVGYGYSRARLGAGGLGLVAAYVLAVLLHATYNFLVSLQVVYGVLMGILLVAGTMFGVRRTLTRLDRQPW